MINIYSFLVCCLFWDSFIQTTPVQQHFQESCQERCESGRHGNCFCNSHCRRHGDCCHDYHSHCLNGTVQQRRHLPALPANASISDVVLAMWDHDTARVPSSSLTLNYQGITAPRELQDRAPGPLFTNVDEQFLMSPSFRHFRRLLDNYNPDVNVAEVMTSNTTTETEDFLDHVVLSKPMLILDSFFRQQGITNDTLGAMKNLLTQLWFEPYNKGPRGVLSSSGFEHVFIGEVRRTSVTGFHNWLQFYLEEKKGNIDYQGYIDVEEPWLIRAQFLWNGRRKQGGSMFVGVSPEFDLSVYTLCIVVESNRPCNFTLLGHDISIRTFDVRSVPGLQVDTAFVTF